MRGNSGRGAGGPGWETSETRERLIKSAERLFAERGFKEVTVREICADAKANVASVNYHFGDKLGLYRAVFRVAIDAIRDATEAAREAGAGQPPEEQLRCYIALFLHRLLMPGAEMIHKLINREVTDPSPFVDELVEQAVRPRVEYLSGVIAGIMGCDRKDPRVLKCVLSVQSQSVIYARPNAVSERFGLKMHPTPSQIAQMADHIAEFSIAGIKAVGRLVNTRT